MPLLKIHTNVPVPPDQQALLLQAMTDLVVKELHKPREYVQVWLEPGCALQFAGNDRPNAFVELRALDLAEARAKPLSAALARLLEEKLAVPPERIFVNFQDVPHAFWGWNGSTFA